MLAAELEHGRHVELSPQGYITGVLSLDVPPGRWVLTCTVALVNDGTVAHDVDVWVGATGTPGSLTFAGPRSAQATVPPGGVASVSLGPFVAEVGPGGVGASLVAMRDTVEPGDTVLVLADTRLNNRAAPTGMLALGATG